MIDLNSMMGKPSATTETSVEATKVANTAFNAIDGSGETKTAPSNIFEGLNEMIAPEQNSYEELEFGTYSATVSKITIKNAKNNAPFATVEWTVLEGDKATKKAVKNYFFANFEGGLNTKKVEKLAEILQVINKATWEQSWAGAVKLLVAFDQGGRKTIIVDSANGLVANNGVLTISPFTPPAEDGKISPTYRVFEYKAA